jgi:glutamyl-tRNA reductase
MVGYEIDNVLQLAYGAAKRVRSETSIGARAVSIASAAIQIAKDIHGDLRQRNTLIVGLGEIGDLIVRQLKAAGAHRISLTGPGRRTEREALSLGFHFLPFDDLARGLARADITVSTAGLGRFLIEKGMVAKALRERRHRPMLFLDGGLPADVEPDVHDLDGAFVYTLDDLEQVALRGRQEREAVAAEAWEIVDRDVERWRVSQNIEAVVPTLVALRARFELTREKILTSQPEIDAHEATRLLVNRLLHAPTRVLRDLAEQGAEKDTGEMLVRRLFALDKDDGMEDER